MASREDWAKRPLAERKIAAQAFDEGYELAYGASFGDEHLDKRFALDLPDQPAQDDDMTLQKGYVHGLYRAKFRVTEELDTEIKAAEATFARRFAAARSAQ